MSFIKRAWKGEEKLWKVFWLYNVLGGIALKLIFGVLTAIIPIFAFIGLAVNIAFAVWALVSLWRCAFNCKVKAFAYLARAYVVLVPVIIIAGLALGGALVGQDLIKAAECRKIVAAYDAMPKDDNAKAFLEQNRAKLQDCASAPVDHSGAAAVAPAAVAASKPTLPASTATSGRNICLQIMKDFAIANKADVESYILANQAYLKQCTATYEKRIAQ